MSSSQELRTTKYLKQVHELNLFNIIMMSYKTVCILYSFVLNMNMKNIK